MYYEVQIANIGFKINSPWDLNFRKEEKVFETIIDTSNYITVVIDIVDKIPFSLDKILYRYEDVIISKDYQHNEFRTYTATFLSTKPIYAQSVLKNNSIHIYYLKSSNIWNNPNMHIWNLLHLEQLLLRNDCMILHCSYMMYKDKAILFSAPSGTGKTTQAKLWEKIYGSKIINGDKCVLKRENGKWFACGFPYHGSADECENLTYPVKAIVAVRQNPEDYIELLHPLFQVTNVYSEITVNSWNEYDVNKTMDLIEDLCNQVTVIKQHCTMNDTAAQTLHQYLYGGNYGII